MRSKTGRKADLVVGIERGGAVQESIGHKEGPSFASFISVIFTADDKEI